MLSFTTRQWVLRTFVLPATVVLFAVLGAPTSIANAASIIRVTTSGATSGTCGGDWTHPCNLLYALGSVANSGDEIWVAAGVYKPTTSTTDRTASIPLKAGVAIYGGFAGSETERAQRDPQAHVTIFSGDIDGDDSQTPIVTDASTETGLGNNSYHVVTGAAGATLDGVTITAGYIPGIDVAGGGLYTTASMTINGVTVSGNRAYGGGGIYSSAPVTVTNSTFTGNLGDDSGGGFYNGGAGTTLTNVTFTNNRATDGAGAAGAWMTLTNVTFTDNIATMRGGGFYASGPATLTDVTFTHNSGGSGGIGGGMCVDGTSLVTLNRVTFTNNYGATTGGGIGAWTGNVVLNNVIFSGNSAGGGGAIGVANGGGHWTLNNVLITGNTAGSGGGIETTSPMTLTNVSLVDNHADCPDCYGGGIVALAPTTIRNSIIWGNTAIGGGYYEICYSAVGHCVVPAITSSDVEGDYNFVSGDGNISVDPLLMPLGDYGGGIQSRALPPNSPVIDAGDPTTCTTTDERGEARDDLRCDMGAFERKYSDGDWVQKSGLAQGTTYSFGPALGKITSNSTTSPGTVTITRTAWTVQPGNAVTRSWDVSATGSGYNLTLSLCFYEPERNGLDPASLHLWRYNGSVWEDKGGTLDTSNLNITCVGTYGVTALSTWTLATGDPGGAPSVMLGSSPNPSSYGQTVTWTATVNGISGVPTGTVAFKDAGADIPGCGNASLNGSGQATCTTASLTIGTHANITAVYSGDANYAGSTSAQFTQTVNQKTLTASVNASNKTYDDSTAATIVKRTLTGIVGSDNVTVTVGAANFVDKNAGSGKTVTATALALSGTNAGNYQLASTSATTTADITARALTVSATGLNKVYDGTPAGTVKLSDNRISGDTLTTSYASASFADPNVGNSKTVNVSGISVTGTDAHDYVANTAATTFANITLAPLTVTANNQSKAAGAPDPAFTFRYSGFVNGETAAVLTTQPTCTVMGAHSTPGTYPITCSGGADENYSFTYVNGALTVAPPVKTNHFMFLPLLQKH